MSNRRQQSRYMYNVSFEVRAAAVLTMFFLKSSVSTQRKKSIHRGSVFSEPSQPVSVCVKKGFSPPVCLTSILSKLSLRGRLFYTLGGEIQHHVIDRAAVPQPHWPKETPPPSLFAAAPPHHSIFFFTIYSFPLHLSVKAEVYNLLV